MSLRAPRFLTFISFYVCSRSSGTRRISTLTSGRVRSQKAVRNGIECSRRALHASSPLSAGPKDPYQVLGVGKDASSADIKKVYFSLARKWHPDTNPDKNARDKFTEIQEAYDILKDEKKRAAYDSYGAASQQPGFDPDAFANAQNAFGGAGGFGGFDFGAAFRSGGRGQADIFEQLFGGAFQAGGRQSGFSQSLRGEDIQTSIGISFMEACKGTSRTVNVQPITNCSTCSGTGLKQGAKRSLCSVCNGTGTRTYTIDSGFHMASTCGTCGGSGSTVPRGSQCPGCAGLGKLRTRKTVQVEIPPGVEDGMTVRVPNAGDAAASGSGSNGDLLVRVNVATSKTFRRQGANLYYDARIPLHTALLGGRVRVPTLDGDVDVRVPGGTQHGEEMMLKGRGVQPVFGGDKGDLYVTFSVQLPRTLNKRQREILQQFADDVEGRSPPPSRKTSEASASDRTPDDLDSSSKRSSQASPHDDNAPTAEVDDNRQSTSSNDDAKESQKRRATA